VIEAFISGTTNESLVHELGRNKPRTTRELFNLATNMPLERRPFEPTLVETRARPLPSWRVALGTVTSKERVGRTGNAMTVSSSQRSIESTSRRLARVLAVLNNQI
jgi:hypothetical protein